MTLDEAVMRACDLLSEEEAYEFLEGIANDDVVLAEKLILRGVLRLPKEDINAFIDAALDNEDIVNMLKSNVHFPDYLREEAKEQLEEFNSKEA